MAGLLAAMSACSGEEYVAQPVVAYQGGGLRAQFFGVSTILLSDGKSAIMTDGFFSRPPLVAARAPLEPNVVAIDGAIKKVRIDPPKVEALLVAHAHYDHVLDTSTVARDHYTNAKVVGSRSTCHIVVNDGVVAARTRLIEGGERLEFGDFRVRPFRSQHGEPRPGLDTPLLGEVVRDFKAGQGRLRDYKEGGNFSFQIKHAAGSVLIHPSTSAEEGQYDDVRADVEFLGVAYLRYQKEDVAKQYWERVVTRTGEKLVIPIHFDDFKRPLSEKPLRYMGWPDDAANDMNVAADIAAQHKNVVFYRMPLFEEVDLLATAGIGPAARRSPSSVWQLAPPRTCPPLPY